MITKYTEAFAKRSKLLLCTRRFSTFKSKIYAAPEKIKIFNPRDIRGRKLHKKINHQYKLLEV